MKTKITLFLLLMLSIGINGYMFQYLGEKEEVLAEIEEQAANDDNLSEWDMFTLALMKVESEYDNTAVSSVGAKGYFQITPIYVKEVNRVHKTDYTFSQVTDFDTAYEIFDLMQKAHNPKYDMNKALELHNGKHKWYNRRVYTEMRRIQKYEEMRRKIKNVNKNFLGV